MRPAGSIAAVLLPLLAACAPEDPKLPDRLELRGAQALLIATDNLRQPELFVVAADGAVTPVVREGASGASPLCLYPGTPELAVVSWAKVAGSMLSVLRLSDGAVFRVAWSGPRCDSGHRDGPRSVQADATGALYVLTDPSSREPGILRIAPDQPTVARELVGPRRPFWFQVNAAGDLVFDDGDLVFRSAAGALTAWSDPDTMERKVWVGADGAFRMIRPAANELGVTELVRLEVGAEVRAIREVAWNGEPTPSHLHGWPARVAGGFVFVERDEAGWRQALWYLPDGAHPPERHALGLWVDRHHAANEALWLTPPWPDGGVYRWTPTGGLEYLLAASGSGEFAVLPDGNLLVELSDYGLAEVDLATQTVTKLDMGGREGLQSYLPLQ